jgi:hypothetical protein
VRALFLVLLLFIYDVVSTEPDFIPNADKTKYQKSPAVVFRSIEPDIHLRPSRPGYFVPLHCTEFIESATDFKRNANTDRTYSEFIVI